MRREEVRDFCECEDLGEDGLEDLLFDGGGLDEAEETGEHAGAGQLVLDEVEEDRDVGD